MADDPIQPGQTDFSADEEQAMRRGAAAARETAGARMQRSVTRDPDRLRTDDQRDAAFKDITGEDRPSSVARTKLRSSFR